MTRERGVQLADRRPWARGLVRATAALLGLEVNTASPSVAVARREDLGAWVERPALPVIILGGPPLEGDDDSVRILPLQPGWTLALSRALAEVTGAKPRSAEARALLLALGTPEPDLWAWPGLAERARLDSKCLVDLLAGASDLTTTLDVLESAAEAEPGRAYLGRARLEAAERRGPSGADTLLELLEDPELPIELRGRALRSFVRGASVDAAQPVLAALIDDAALAPLAPDLEAPQTAVQDLRDVERLFRTRVAGGTAAEVVVRDLIADGAPWSALKLSAHESLGAAVLAGADRAGASRLVELVGDLSFDTELRASALVALATKERSRRAHKEVERALLGEDPTLGLGGLEAALALGEDGVASLQMAALRSPVAAVRVGALDALALLLAPARLHAMLEATRADADLLVRRAASRVRSRELGIEQADLRRLPEEEVEAAAEGLADLGEQGVPSLLAWAKDDLLSAESRQSVLRALERFEARASWFEAHPELRALEAVETTQPFAPAEDTAPLPPAAGTRRFAPAQQTAPVPPVHATHRTPPAERPTEPIHPAAVDLLVEADWATEVARTQRVEAASDDEASQVAASGPRPRVAVRRIPLDRAQEAYDAATRAGADGERMFRALAGSERVPELVRVSALRSLLERFPSASVDGLLESLLVGSGHDALRGWALRAAAQREPLPVEAVAVLAQDESAAVGLRVRAIRHLGGLTDKGALRARFDGLLASPEPRVARAALLALFSTLRFTPDDRIEAALVNLLDRHRGPEVCASAARALGVFGTKPASIKALRRARGLLAHSAVNEAVDWALFRRQA